MHKSQLAGFIIDCNTDNLDEASKFWSAALGMPAKKDIDPDIYRTLDSRPGEVHVEVQKVSHASRLHLDIETDDLEAEASRLEALGARRIAFLKRWWVMEAPTGQRFCIVNPVREGFADTANRWD